MNLEERIKNGTTELQDYYRIALRDIEKHKANITKLNMMFKDEQEKLYKAWELKRKCEIRAEEQKSKATITFSSKRVVFD